MHGHLTMALLLFLPHEDGRYFRFHGNEVEYYSASWSVLFRH